MSDGTFAHSREPRWTNFSTLAGSTRQTVTQPYRDNGTEGAQALPMEPHGGPARELPVDLDALIEAEAKLAILHPGSRDHALMAELVARLNLSADQWVRRQIRRAALRDGAALSGCRRAYYRSGYDGPVRPQYRAFLAGYISALGGSLEDGRDGLVAVFSGHRIRMHFGPSGSDESDGADESTAAVAVKRRDPNVELRAAFVQGAEARSQSDQGRGLTGAELTSVLERYAGDVEEG